MPFNVSDVVLEAGDHVLDARAGASGWHAGKKAEFGPGAGGRSFTFHHVLPYRYPQFVGYLLAAFARTYAAGPGEWADDLYNLREKLLREPNIRPDEYPTAFAWMPANLFVGPKGNLRADDPGSGRERQKPDRFPPKQWAALHELGDFLDTRVFKAVAPRAGGGTVVTTHRVTGREFLAFHRQLLKVSGTSGKMYHPFRPEDWVALESSDPKFPTPADMPTPAERDRFKAHAAARPEAITVSQVGKYRGQPGPLTVRFLRLRGPDDRPAATLDANLMVGDAV